jgi:pyruvate,water dikinase
MEEFLTALLGEDVLPAARQLLQGFDNKSVAMGEALWSLSRWIRHEPGMSEALANARLSGGQVDLGTHPRRPEFDGRWQAFLDEFGWRSDVFMEMGHPSWREDHSSALTQLRRYTAMDDGDDPFAGHHAQAQLRPDREAALEAQLPDDARPVFRMLLHAAQQYLPIAEDHNFTIDQKFTMVMREAFLHLGDRLVEEGALAEPDDVFYLEYEEVLALAGDTATDGFADAVATRKATRATQRMMDPPLMIGALLTAEALAADPITAKFFGVGIQPSTDPHLVVGHGVSNGVAEGTARVIHTLDDADRLEPGDILVCPMTMPAWTPLFGVAGGVVCDSGGPLSHCAIVAREYAIPCVAGTVIGTAKIADGAHLRVDGAAGRVTIIE